MLGYWLSRSDAIYATQRAPYQFDKLSNSLNRRGTNSKNREYFVPQMYCTDDFKSKNIPCQEEVNSDTLDELVANVDFNNKEADPQTEALNKDLKKARLGKVLADTKLIGEKLEQRKRELYYQWSERFFNSFTEHFGKLKNVITQLHLNQQQINKFNQCLDSCLKNMQGDLSEIWTEFKQEQQDEQN